MKDTITFILANAAQLLLTGKPGFDYIASVRTEAKASGDWTPDNEVALQAILTTEKVDPTWQLDAPEPPPEPPVVAPEPIVPTANQMVIEVAGVEYITAAPLPETA